MKNIFLVVSLSLLLISCSRTPTIDNNLNTSTGIQISSWFNSEWLEINNHNFWTNIPGHVPLGISFSYPSTATFNCCSIRKDWWIHRVDLKIPNVDSDQSPYIFLMKYISNCKVEDMWYFEESNCKSRLSHDESYKYLTTTSGWVLPSNIGSGFVEVSRDWIMMTDILNPSEEKAFVLEMDDQIYLIQFYNFQLLPVWFIRTFLSKISPDSTTKDSKIWTDTWEYFHDIVSHYTIEIPPDWWSISPFGGCINDSLYSGMELIIPMRYNKICQEKDSTDSTFTVNGIWISSHNDISNPTQLPFIQWYEDFTSTYAPNNYDVKKTQISPQIVEYDLTDKASHLYVSTTRIIDHGEGRRMEFHFNKYNQVSKKIVDSVKLD